MSTALRLRSIRLPAGHGGAPARRAVIRWAWRLYRREWRQQLLVLALLTVAVAATCAGLALATNVPSYQDGRFGTASQRLTIPGSDPRLAADIAAARTWFGTIDVIEHQRIGIPGSIATVDIRAQDPHGPYGYPTVRLLAGRYPTGSDEVAVTTQVEALFDLHPGGLWREGGRVRRVVGLVENPQDLRDLFALVPAGQADPPASVTILLDTTEARLGAFRFPSGTGLLVEGRSLADKSVSAAIVLVLATIGLLFVALLAVAGFTVMAQRRLRAMGMLEAIGATDRHVRLVMLTNGAVVGAVAAVAGAAIGVGGWLAFAPRLERIAEHRIDRFNLPWWAIVAAMLLAVIAAVAAAWWPARSVARIPAVAALSGRPPRPQPAHRFAVMGGSLLAVGLVLLALSHHRRPVLIVTGVVAVTLGLLFLSPLAIRGIAAVGGRSPIAVRLALRDLARYRARAGAALGAIVLAVGIATTIAVSAAAQEATNAQSPGNLPANQLIVHLGGETGDVSSPLPDETPAQLQALETRVRAMATSLHARALVPLDEAVDPNGSVEEVGPNAQDVRVGPGTGTGGRLPAFLATVVHVPHGEEINAVVRLYVATPEVLRHYGISPGQIDPDVDVVTSRSGVGGLTLISGGPRRGLAHPRSQTIHLPTYTSDPSSLITLRAMQKLGLEARPAGWLIETPSALTPAQIESARRTAIAAGVTIETKSDRNSLSRLGTDATAAGILLALGVLAMTVGLIRSETAGDLRTLAATGADGTTRRTLTAATAGALALLGALLGAAGAYLTQLAWHRSDPGTLAHVPIVHLVAIVIGLPLLATVGGWLLAGRQPPAISRQPLE
jgi:putative ABC transport system permease protein